MFKTFVSLLYGQAPNKKYIEFVMTEKDEL